MSVPPYSIGVAHAEESERAHPPDRSRAGSCRRAPIARQRARPLSRQTGGPARAASATPPDNCGCSEKWNSLSVRSRRSAGMTFMCASFRPSVADAGSRNSAIDSDRPVRLRKLRTNIWKTWIMPSQTCRFDLDAGGARLVRKHHGIIQHRFAVADLNQERRQVRRGRHTAATPADRGDHPPRRDNSLPAPGSSAAGGSGRPRRG